MTLPNYGKIRQAKGRVEGGVGEGDGNVTEKRKSSTGIKQ